MGNRKNIKIDSDVYNRLTAAKQANDTWDEFLSRLVNSAAQEQMHVDRATLQDFGTKDKVGIGLRASPEGELELQLLDKSGTPIGVASLESLDGEQEVHLNVTIGEQVDRE